MSWLDRLRPSQRARDAADPEIGPDRAADAPPSVTAPTGREWLDLPILQPTVAPLRLVAAGRGFVSHLGTWKSPQFIAPLGHEISKHGPAGLVTLQPVQDAAMPRPISPSASGRDRTANDGPTSSPDWGLRWRLPVAVATTRVGAGPAAAGEHGIDEQPGAGRTPEDGPAVGQSGSAPAESAGAVQRSLVAADATVLPTLSVPAAPETEVVPGDADPVSGSPAVPEGPGTGLEPLLERRPIDTSLELPSAADPAADVVPPSPPTPTVLRRAGLGEPLRRTSTGDLEAIPEDLVRHPSDVERTADRLAAAAHPAEGVRTSKPTSPPVVRGQRLGDSGEPVAPGSRSILATRPILMQREPLSGSLRPAPVVGARPETNPLPVQGGLLPSSRLGAGPSDRPAQGDGSVASLVAMQREEVFGLRSALPHDGETGVFESLVSEGHTPGGSASADTDGRDSVDAVQTDAPSVLASWVPAASGRSLTAPVSTGEVPAVLRLPTGPAVPSPTGAARAVATGSPIPGAPGPSRPLTRSPGSRPALSAPVPTGEVPAVLRLPLAPAVPSPAGAARAVRPGSPIPEVLARSRTLTSRSGPVPSSGSPTRGDRTAAGLGRPSGFPVPIQTATVGGTGRVAATMQRVRTSVSSDRPAMSPGSGHSSAAVVATLRAPEFDEPLGEFGRAVSTGTTDPVDGAFASPLHAGSGGDGGDAHAAAADAGDAAPHAAPHAAPQGDSDIDQLARRLYPRLRDRWRAEMRLDRERAGRFADTRI